MTPFVGRSRELSRLRTLLDARRNIVLTGTFGSGRTALVRRLADVSAGAYHFVLADRNSTRREIDHQIRTTASRVAGRVVGVLDDVAAVTTPRLRFLREEVRSDHASWLVIVERSLDPAALGRLRAALGAAALVRPGPPSQAAAERLVSEGLRVRQLEWDVTTLRALARTAHGHALTLRMGVDAVLQSRAIDEPPGEARCVGRNAATQRSSRA
jgi:hypothetical protein